LTAPNKVYILLNVRQESNSTRELGGREYAAACAVFNLRAASRRITSLYNARLRKSGVLITQLPLLVALDYAGPMPLTRLAEELEMDRTTLSRNWLPLVRSGLTREQSTADKRVRVLAITDKGSEALALALQLWNAAQAEVVASMGDEGYRAFLGQLGKLQMLGRRE
jgi:DNA-binding MarR family transcriptional regulator